MGEDTARNKAARRICPLSTPELVGKLLGAIEKLCKVTFYSFQRVFVARVIESILDNDVSTITALWARQCGKSTAVACMAFGLCVWLPLLASMFPDDDRLSPFLPYDMDGTGFRIGIFAPVEDQARETFGRMRDVANSDHAQAVLADPEVGISIISNRGDIMVLSNGSHVRCRTASDDANIEGKTYDLVICVAGDTEVVTPGGARRIRDLVDEGYTGTVLALDHATGSVVWADVVDRQRVMGAGDAYELVWSDGTRVTATGDHLWWVDGVGYVETRELCRLSDSVVQSRDGRTTYDPGDASRRLQPPDTSKGVGEPEAGGESQRTTARVRGGQGVETGEYGSATEGDRLRQSWEGESVGEASDAVQPSPSSGVACGVQPGEEGSHRGVAQPLDGGVAGVLVDGRRVSWRGEQSSTFYARVQPGGTGEDLCVVLGDGVSSGGHSAPEHGGEKSAVSDARVRRHERDGGGVHLSEHGVQVRDDAARGLHHLRGIVHSVPDDGLESLLFVGVSSGKAPEVRRLKSCRRVPAPEVVYDLTTTTGNFFAGGVLSHNCEEAQKISKAQVDKAIRPMLAATSGTMVKIGTAWESRGGFHTDIQQNNEVQRRGGPRNHFEIPYDVVLREKQATYDEEKRLYDEETRLLEEGKLQERTRLAPKSFHLRYAKFIRSEITRLGGTDSLEFKMNFRCLWSESRVIAVDPETLARAALTEMEATFGPCRVGFQVAGLDLGKQNDKTVLTVGMVDYANGFVNLVSGPDADEEKQTFYPKYIQDWLVTEGAFEGTNGQYEMLVDYLRWTGVRVLVMDATGMAGGVIYERLQVLIGSSVTIVPFNFSSLKPEGYKYYLQELKAGRVYYPAGVETQQTFTYQQFVKEHLELDRVVSGNIVRIQAPEDDENAHDDFPDSAMLFCWGEKIAADVMMPDVECTTAESWRASARGHGAVKPHRYARR